MAPRSLGLTLAVAPIVFFLLLPSLIIIPMALTKGQLIQFPPQWISIHAFTDYLSDPQWMRSTLVSFQVSAFAVLVGGVTGTCAALALHGKTFAGKSLLTGLVLAPIVIPLIVLALGSYLVFAPLRLVGTWPGIGLVHALLVTPYVFISAQTSLTAELNPALVRSARSLGAGRWPVFRHVIWPAIRPGVLSGCVMGFAVSFDEVVVALFLQGPDTVTLPVRMFTAIQFELTPKIAASASLFILLATLALVAQGLLARRRPA
ncbi:MAG TPA: ABC transporter permease [Rhodopila sp.]|uniref:ABC transporter permease n=1 Tax=Rhodopila sp. TaxID=2480087 RepID=UPI002D0B5658|nr:ABC transporter permease [Rhodopila sp.]HVY18233.1 ABC transporter permease [Rhodopila sp.]